MSKSISITSSRPISLIRNGAWNIFFTLWSAAVTFFLTPFLIASIGTDHYGLFVLLMSVSGLMGIMDLGLGQATLRYVAHYYGRNDLDGVNRVVGATFFVYIFSGVTGWSILFFGAPFIVSILSVPQGEVELSVKLLHLTAFNFGISFISGAFSSIPQALRRFDISTKMSVVQNIFQVCGTVGILVAGYGIYELVVWSVVTSIFNQAISIVVVKRLIPRIRLRPTPTREGLREIFGYGIYSLATNIMGMIWGQADRLLLGILVNPASVGYLTVPQQISFRGSGIVASAGGALFPKFSSMEDRGSIRQLYLVSTWIMLCATVALFVPFTILIPDFLRLWINPEFAAKSSFIGQLIACSCIVRGAFVPYDALFRGMGKPQYLTIQFLGSGITSLVLNIILIPRLGLAGAGYCYLATLIWGFVAIVFAWKRVLEMPSLIPLMRSVIVPIGLGFVLLLAGNALRSTLPAPDWTMFGLLSVSFVVMTAAVLIGAEWFFGGRNSHAVIFFGIISSALQRVQRAS